jgi:hypothetical protein
MNYSVPVLRVFIIFALIEWSITGKKEIRGSIWQARHVLRRNSQCIFRHSARPAKKIIKSKQRLYKDQRYRCIQFVTGPSGFNQAAYCVTKVPQGWKFSLRIHESIIEVALHVTRALAISMLLSMWSVN